MKAFVTGGTGFIGARLVEKLVQRGYQVSALVRSQASAAHIRSLNARPVWGNINALESLSPAMAGCDYVFHLAAWYQLGAKNWREAETTNVEGTRNVLATAIRLKIPRIIYTSTVAVFGDTRGFLADETYFHNGDARHSSKKFLTEYDRTKWLAHYQVALPFVQQGAPVIIVMPGAVYGPGDPSLVGDMLRWYYRGWLPVVPGPETRLTFAHVDDIAEGLILAAEKGTPGESYILAGPSLSLAQIFELWAQILGRRPPAISVPAHWLKPFRPGIAALGNLLPLPRLFSQDALAILGATYIARSDKACDQLGWRPRPPELGFAETFDWLARFEPATPLLLPQHRRWLAALGLSAALGLFGIWLASRRRR